MTGRVVIPMKNKKLRDGSRRAAVFNTGDVRVETRVLTGDLGDPDATGATDSECVEAKGATGGALEGNTGNTTSAAGADSVVC